MKPFNRLGILSKIDDAEVQELLAVLVIFRHELRFRPALLSLMQAEHCRLQERPVRGGGMRTWRSLRSKAPMSA